MVYCRVHLVCYIPLRKERLCLVNITSCSLQDINEEWISDKTRFCYDGLKRQRLNDPMIRGPDGRFKAVTWRDALAVVAEVLHQVKPEEITGVAGKLSDAESMMALKDFVNRMGSDKVLCEGNGPNPPADLRSNYLMNTGIAGLEKADVFLLVGTLVGLSSLCSWLIPSTIFLIYLRSPKHHYIIQSPMVWCRMLLQ